MFVMKKRFFIAIQSQLKVLMIKKYLKNTISFLELEVLWLEKKLKKKKRNYSQDVCTGFIYFCVY